MEVSMLRTFAVALLVLVTLAFVTGMAADKTHNYVGADKCKICHKGEAKGMAWETWEKSAHSKAYQSLVNKKDGSEKDAKCLPCHTTGMGKATGYVLGDTTANNKTLVNVGCEACHGPGSDYKSMNIMKDKAKSAEAGLMKPDEKTCKGCHNEGSPTFKGFDFATSWKKIQHPAKAAATGK
jgi:hypothetical protein